MRRLTRRESVLITVLFILAAVYIITQYWYYPLLSEIKRLKAEKHQLLGKWETIQPSLGQEENIKQANHGLEHDINKLQDRLIPENASYLFWKEVRKLAEQSDANLTFVQEGNDERNSQSGSPVFKHVQLQVNGTFASIEGFMNTLKRMPWVYAVTEGKWSRQGEGEIIATFSLIVATKTSS
ncbi:MAG: hypothetical protein H0Z33_08760 [Bacillaceae bacterium]|nr:hypothetical protein [Bacillaceae bacterium]